MNLASVTPLIITLNEERNIPRVLARLQWANRIVVIDSFSSDSTVSLLRDDPRVQLHQRRFDSFSGQLNFGIEQVTTPWVLALDADFVCSEQLAREIVALPAEPGESAFFARFRYCVWGKPLRRTLFPPREVLYRRDCARYHQDGHQQKIEIAGSTGWLSSTIDHDDRKPLRSWLAAQVEYADREADKLLRADTDALDFADRVRRRKYILPLLMPLYCLLYKGLILDGPRGLFYTAQRTYAELLVSLLLAERDFEARRSANHSERGDRNV